MTDTDFKLELKNVLRTGPSLSQGIACILLLQGTTDIAIDGESHLLQEDDLVVINHNQVYAIHSESDNLMLTLQVDGQRLQKECGPLAGNRLLCNGASGSMGADGTYFELKRILVNMFNVKLDKPYGYGLNLNMNLLRFLHLLYTTYSLDTEQGAPLHGEPGEQDHARAVLEFIQKNCHRSITLQETAAHFYLSPAYFSKQFKRITGVGYLQYLQRVRVEKSLPRLLYSDDSILQIAMDNGFANPKAYTGNFMRYYGETPSAYRKQHQQSAAQQPLESTQILMENDPPAYARMEFLRYVKKYEVQTGQQQGPVDESHTIHTKRPPLRTLRPMENLLLIDTPQAALQQDFAFCLQCKENFNVQYAYFQLLDYNESDRLFGTLLYHQIIDSVHALWQYGLIPFIRLDFSDQPFEGDDDEVLAFLRDKLHPLLKTLRQNFPLEWTRHWRFEVVCSSFSGSRAAFFYKQVWQMVAELFSGSPVGLYADPDSEGESQVGSRFGDLLADAKRMGMAPSFVTFHGFQNRLKQHNPVDAVFYSGAEGFHADIAASVQVVCNQHGVAAPLYMTAWNTFSGEQLEEINVYVRTGLIMEVLMDLYNTVKGVGYRLAQRNTCPYSGEPYGSPLNLYVFKKTKRPVYYVACMIDRMGGALLYQTKHVAASQNAEGELVVTVWNPQYLSPARSLDGLLTSSLTQQVRVELTGMENRTYNIKRFTLDIESNGTITRLHRSGYPDWRDKDVYQHMQDTTGIDLFYFNQEAENGSLVLTSTVRYNGIVMYVLE